MNGESRALDVHLAEYTRAYTEIFSRFESQRLAFNVLIAAFAAVLAVDKTLSDARIGEEICCWAPLIVASLGYIFFDNELQIWKIATYMRDVLRARVVVLTGDDSVLGLDGRTIDAVFVKRTAIALSLGRWIFFLIPALAAFLAAAPLFARADYHPVLAFCDLCAVALLVAGIAAAARQQFTWLHGGGSTLK